MREIGKIIKENRIKNNLSQEDLGKKLNMTRQAISNWERGKTQPDIDTIKKLSEIFDISIDDFLYDGREESYNFKMIWFLLLISIVIGFISLFISKYKNISQIFILPAYIVLTVVFYLSIKNGSYGIIAGYDKNINYNKKVLNKILYNIALLSVLDVMIYQILNLVLILTKGPMIVYKIILYGIIISFFINIFAINTKYREELIPDKEERDKLKKESKPTNIFFIKFLFTIVVFILMFEISNTKNNTMEALKFIGLLIPNTILFLVMTLRREYNKSEYLFRSDKIMILISFVLDFITVIYGLKII